MKLSVLLPSLLAVALTANCQPDCRQASLPTADALHAALDSFHHHQLMATLAEFDDAPGNTWMNWTPAIGTGFNLQGQPRPTVSFSLSQVFTNLERRRERKAKRRSIKEAAQLELAQLHSQLAAMLLRHEMLLLELETMREAFDIDRQLHELETSDYEAAKLSPMQYLPKRKAFINARLAVMMKEAEVREVEREVLTFSKFVR